MIPVQSIRTVADAVISPYCLYHLIGEQSSGDMRNLKPGGSAAIKDASFTDAEAWVNPGYMTTGADSTAIATLPLADAGFTLDGFSLILAVRFRKALPAGTEPFVSSVAPGSTYGGIIIDGRNTGSTLLTVSAVDTGSNPIGVAGTQDGNEHTIVYFIPRGGSDTGSMLAYLDGKYNGSGSAANVRGKDCRGPRDLRLGSAWPSISAVACRIGMLAAYNVPKDMSDLNKPLIADYLQRNPGMPLEAWHL